VSGQTPPAGQKWLRGLAPLAPRALGYDKPLCASLDGFTLHAATKASALYSKSLLQRCFRDVHAVTQNFVVAPPVHEIIGKVLLGVEADTALF
jgi:hypothetical protein